VQGAQLGTHHQDNGLRVGLAEQLGGAQCRESCVAAHKPQVVALDSGIQAQLPDDLIVRARVEEPGAGDGDEMSYVK
jgi:hypothetical protein